MRTFSIMTILGGCLFIAINADAQLPAVREGNKYYREGNFEEALKAYDKAVTTNPADPTAMYNRSNALVKKGDASAALGGYEEVIEKGKDKKLTQQSWYNKGVVHQQGKELDKSIDAWKIALKLDPEDKQARENLQKALREKKQQQQQQPKDQQQKQQEQQKPQPQQSKLNQKQVEQLLKALEQKEKEIQKKLQQKGPGVNRPEKDW